MFPMWTLSVVMVILGCLALLNAFTSAPPGSLLNNLAHLGGRQANDLFLTVKYHLGARPEQAANMNLLAYLRELSARKATFLTTKRLVKGSPIMIDIPGDPREKARLLSWHGIVSHCKESNHGSGYYEVKLRWQPTSPEETAGIKSVIDGLIRIPEVEG